jgi:hypothetical protein
MNWFLICGRKLPNSQAQIGEKANLIAANYELKLREGTE